MFAQLSSAKSSTTFPMFIVDQILPFLQQRGTTFEHGGHNRIDIQEIRASFSTRLVAGRPSQLDLFDLLWRLGQDKTSEQPLRLKLGHCRSCGEAMVYETLDGRVWRIVNPCSRANRPAARAEIEVPSGVLLFHHDLRSFLSPMPDKGWVSEEERHLKGLSADSVPGITALLRFYAREGVLRLPIRAHASLVPTTEGWDLANPGLDKLRRPSPGQRTLISNHDLLMAADSRLAHLFPTALAEAARVPCKPGWYRITVHPDAYEEARRAPVTYASMERVRDC